MTNDQMTFNANTVDRNALFLERFNEADHSGGFGADAFHWYVVFVDLVKWSLVYIRIGICSASSLQGNVDVIRTNGVVEYVRPPSLNGSVDFCE